MNTTAPSHSASFVAGQTTFALLEGDCLRALPHLGPETIDLVVTSPPYNLGIQYSKYEDSRAADEYVDWCLQWAAEVKRVLKPTGSLFLNLGSSPKRPLLPHQVVISLTRLFVLQNTFHWIKSISIETRNGETVTAGHFKPLPSNRYVTDCHEFVFHLTKTGDVPLDRRGIGVPYADKSNIKRWGHTGGRDLRCRGNNWFIPYETICSRDQDRPHPATFPTALGVQCIKLHGLGEATTMLDPFVGIGHSAVAARECRIQSFVGIDIDPRYLATARDAILRSAGKGRPGKRRSLEANQPGLF